MKMIIAGFVLFLVGVNFFVLESLHGRSVSKYSYAVPLLEECVSPVENILKEYTGKFDLEYEIIEFGKVIKSHPDVVGYVKLLSDSIDVDGLDRKANAFLLDCYPQSRTSIRKSDQLGEDIGNAVRRLREFGVEKIRFVDAGADIQLIYKLDDKHIQPIVNKNR